MENIKGIRWRIALPESVDKDNDVYFLRTNVDKIDEETTWNYYNLIREIECTNRQLKTDLNLRPNLSSEGQGFRRTSVPWTVGILDCEHHTLQA